MASLLTLTVVAAGCSGGTSTPTSSGPSSSGSVTISGTVIAADIIGAGSNCQQTGGRFDDVPGMEVDVTDGSGTVIAVTHLGTSSSGRMPATGGFAGCGYTFTASGVPRQPVYGFKVDGKDSGLHISDLSQAVTISLTR